MDYNNINNMNNNNNINNMNNYNNYINNIYEDNYYINPNIIPSNRYIIPSNRYINRYNNYYINNYYINDINNDMENLSAHDSILQLNPAALNQLIITINLIGQNISRDETPIETFTRLGIQVNTEVKSEVKPEEEEAKEICSVCLDDENCVDCETSCSHNFHANCLSQWVNKNNSCPLCREKITSVNTNI